MSSDIAEASPFPARALFDIPRETAYFNVAALGPLLTGSVATAAEAVARRARPWVIPAADWFDRSERRRAAFAALLGTAADNIALVPAASYGFAVAAANIVLSPSQAILCIDGDFPSGINSWHRRAADSGARLILARPEAGESWTDALLRHWTADVALVSASPVRWMDGALIDLLPIAARARQEGAALVVDATQWIGAAPFDLDAVDPDYLVCAGYKWLLGPYGLGYLYVAPRRHEGRPLEENWISRRGTENFARLAEHHPVYRAGARRYDAGEQVGFELGDAAIHALDQLRIWGTARIGHHLAGVTSAIAARLAEEGFSAATNDPRAPHIVSVQADGRWDSDPDLARSGVFLSKRGASFRIAPHVHIDEEDIERLVAAMRP